MKHRKDSSSNRAMDQTDEFHSPSISYSKSDICKWSSLSSKKSLELYGKRKTLFDSRDHLNESSNEGNEDLATSQPINSSFQDSLIDDQYDCSLPLSFGKKKLTYPGSEIEQKWKKPFSLILPRIRNSICKRSDDEQIETENNLESSYEILRSGMLLLKNYISISDQVEIVNICQELGIGPGGFYQPGYQNGGKLRLQMMCLGRNWDPQTKYDDRYRNDGSEAPPIPDKLISLVKDALQRSRGVMESEDEIPLMSPDICIVNFYSTTGRLGLHRDRDESPDSLGRGLPVISVSIGDSGEFLYGDNRNVDDANKVSLKSGDVLIFGGKSRHIFHGVETITPNSAPLPLLKKTMLRPGRLNLTFRQF